LLSSHFNKYVNALMLIYGALVFLGQEGYHSKCVRPFFLRACIKINYNIGPLHMSAPLAASWSERGVRAMKRSWKGV